MCAEFLKLAHPKLGEWFRAEQSSDPELHITCSQRGRAAQDAIKAKGGSKASYGKSPHNYLPSLAIDVYRRSSKGEASWPIGYFHDIALRLPADIEWGGDWNHNGRYDDEDFIDGPHFQLVGWKKLAKNYPNGT